MKDRLSIVVFATVFIGFAAALVLYLLFGAPQRFVGAVLLTVGGFAALAARSVADGGRKSVRVVSLGTRSESTLRPTTVVLWGIGVAVMGLLLLLGL